MPPMEQCKLWGLREALRMLGEDDTQFQNMAERVFVNGEGTNSPTNTQAESPCAHSSSVWTRTSKAGTPGARLRQSEDQSHS